MITGASRGLGEHIARALTNYGFNTLLCARDMDKLKDLADEFNQQEPGDSIALPIDFHRPESLRDISQAIPKQWPPISVLINNAGYYRPAPLEDTNLNHFKKHMEVNCQGPFILARELVPKMARQGSGFVANILATGAVEARLNHCAYNASKFALRGLTLSLSEEFQDRGVHLVAITVNGEIDSPKKRSEQPHRDPSSFINPRSIAREIIHLYEQPRDAWTRELDLHPQIKPGG